VRADRPVRPGLDRSGAGEGRDGPGREPQRPADRDAPRRPEAELQVDAAIGGARRDEEKARAKERFFSHRDSFGQWDPKNQRPELWNLYNGRKNPGRALPGLPLSNWTEMDVWQYIQREGIPIPTSTSRMSEKSCEETASSWPGPTSSRSGSGDEVTVRRIRFRTIGDATCTGAFESEADSWRRSSGRPPPPGSRSGAGGATTSAPRPPWKTASGRGTSDERRWTLPETDLLRFTTAGSVDDGKSTLIGRLLFDTKSIFEDQLEQMEGMSRKLGEEG
jgi:3'-phosphoadenosine 5'-phosphosulfate sulfotransferase (PAPS reductase)/FAD synthetase